jgi:hypothetical protein
VSFEPGHLGSTTLRRDSFGVTIGPCPENPGCFRIEFKAHFTVWIEVDAEQSGDRLHRVYAHEQRHVASYQSFLVGLERQLTEVEEAYNCKANRQQLEAVATEWRAAALQAVAEFTMRERAHANPPPCPQDPHGLDYEPLGLGFV